jgi:DDE family transposase
MRSGEASGWRRAVVRRYPKSRRRLAATGTLRLRRGPLRHHLRPQERHTLAGASKGIRVQRRYWLETAKRLTRSGDSASSTGRGRPWTLRAYRPKRGREDRPKPRRSAAAGSKRHLLVDRSGIPLAVMLTGAQIHDSKVFEALVDGVEPVKGAKGRPRKRPDKLHADKGSTTRVAGRSFADEASRHA